MYASISHTNANSQYNNSYSKTIAHTRDYNKLLGMNINDEKKRIAAKYRSALRYWMGEKCLSVDSWCKRAGIREGTLRNFLNGTSDSMLSSTVELLASAIGISLGQLLREEIIYEADDDLLNKSAEAIQNAAQGMGIKLDLAHAMTYTVMLYKHVKEFRQRGEKIDPTESSAALILKTVA